MARPWFDLLLSIAHPVTLATGCWASVPSIALWTVLTLVLILVLVPMVFVIGVVAMSFFCVFMVPRQVGKAIGWAALRPFYQIHLHHPERIPRRGGVLLLPNHVSWIDGFLLMMMTKRLVRTVVFAGNFPGGITQTAARRWEAIMMRSGPKSIFRALRTARQALESGEVVGVFAEGGITRSGMTQSLKPGFLKMVEGTDAAVIPIYYDGLWGSIFSFSERKFFWKIPRRWPLRIDIYFGEPLYHVSDVHTVRQAIQQLGAKAVSERIHRKTDLPESVIRNCKRRKFESKIADSTGVDLTGGQVLMRSLIIRRVLRRLVLDSDERYVGVLLPPSTGAVLTNMALAFDRRVAINLNYTVSADVMQECIAMAGVRRVLTSHAVMDKLDLKIDAEIVYLDDLRSEISLTDKLISLLASYVVPGRWLCRWLGLGKNEPDDTLTVIFTSGSTGIPKGVMLTHANIRHNVDAIHQVIHLQHKDTIVGILPFFHSFGFTITLWGVMSLDIRGVYHFNPLDARQIGKLIQKHQATILLSTPTFLRSYYRRCSKDEFASIDAVIAGAEKLPKELSDAFENKFNIRPIEGYGTTELSPLVSVNIPPSRSSSDVQVDRREGTVGRPVPGVAAKIVDDDGQELGTGQPGMLLISGANVMKGYINQPKKTAEVMRDGWYVTGDVAEIDDDGFIKITGRLSRFSKIGGEMVPHLQIEECLQEIIGQDEDEGELKIAVTSVPDPKKGERLIVLHTELKQMPGDLTAALKAKGLPNIFTPSPDSFFQVEEIPVLGTGKLDLQGLKELAAERVKA